ncbi:MAG TPA: hypothetical protein IGS52_24150 [Oscillatoriaceae cyanobacterium M33_DOE_052]|uniref:Uncharacterized protein n=1 Tax=Planktothricoides sp. SpSt-374 TaxID=2282167 RepID=A0A7C3VF67_9CYAN|nr:hypothetical protein [Oscillatoriaceae cyanobacterium M33_DOE_052]
MNIMPLHGHFPKILLSIFYSCGHRRQQHHRQFLAAVEIFPSGKREVNILEGVSVLLKICQSSPSLPSDRLATDR